MYILLMCFSFLAGFVTSKNPQLTIDVQNIEVVEGNIRIGVFNRSESFLKQGTSFRTYVVAVEGNTETIVINDLPKGDYAFMLYHDMNSDGRLNQNILGIPTEPFGFSNNVKPKFAKPTFEECRFLLAEDRVMNIGLRYFR